MILLVFSFIIGLITGSFLFTYLQTVGEKSIIKPTSHCPQCEAKLKVVDLILVISFIINGGKFRIY